MADISFPVDDSSPAISYFPFADTLSIPDILAGWNPYFDQSGFATALGQTGNGTSFHITALDGASFQLSWHGTAIQLYGNATQASFIITLDGVVTQANSSDSSGNVLAAFSGLANTNHTITLTAHTNSVADSFIAFDKAVVTSSTPDDITLNPQSIFQVQSLNDSDIAFLGQWTIQNKSFIGQQTTFHESHNPGDRSIAAFTGTALLLEGLTSPNGGKFSVTIDNDTSSTFIASSASSFSSPDTLLFFTTGLDPLTVHQIEVTNVGGAVLALQVGGFGIVELENYTSSPLSTSMPTQTPSPSPSSSPSPVMSSAITTSFPTGTIAALTLAGILAFIAIASVLFILLVYRPRKRRRRLAQRAMREDRQRKTGENIVLDISPGGADTSEEYDHSHGMFDSDVIGAAGNRSSKGTGYGRWKEEVEGRGAGFAVLARFGLTFRHSDEDIEEGDEEGDEKRRVSDAGDDRNGNGDEPNSGSDRSGSFRAAMARALGRSDDGKGKGKKRSMSLGWTNRSRSRSRSHSSRSPSYAIDLPLPTLTHSRQPASSQPHSHSGSYTHNVTPPTPHSRTGTDSHISYISSNHDPAHLSPPSVSTSTSPQISHSSQSGPTPPPMPSPLIVSTPPKHQHQRTDSSGGLLQHGLPNPGSPDDDEAYVPRTYLQLPHGDRGSVVGEYEEALSLHGATQVAVRGLSPRTSEMQTPFVRGAEARMATREQQMSDRGGSKLLSFPVSEDRGEALGETRKDLEPLFLDVRESSPFRVDFASSPRHSPPSSNRTSSTPLRVSGLSHVRFQADMDETEQPEDTKGKETDNQGAKDGTKKPARVPFRLTPLTPPSLVPPPENQGSSSSDSEAVTSFLDFSAGSSDASILTRSNRDEASQRRGSFASTTQPPQPMVSRWSATTDPANVVTKSSWSNTTPSDDAIQRQASGSDASKLSNGSSGTNSGSSPSSTFPFPVSMPSSPHYRQESDPGSPPEIAARPSLVVQPPAYSQHPYDLASMTSTSPTDSIPMTVSDIHFRSNTDSEGDPASQRASLASHIPRHPPLPGMPADGGRMDSPAPDTSFIVQHVLGLHNRSGSGVIGPLASPLTNTTRYEFSSPATPLEDYLARRSPGTQ